MTTQPRLDGRLLQKIAEARGKSQKYVREQISKTAARLGITSQAAQIIIARELGISTALAVRKLAPHVQDQVRSAKVSTAGLQQERPLQKSIVKPPKAPTGVEILSDPELKSRCADLLKAKKHFDRVFREATTVLDHRIKEKSGIAKMNPVALVGKALNPNPAKSILVVSEDSAVQEGMHSICKGLMLAFRDKAHHELNDKLTRNDAIKFCGFIDTVLTLIEGAQLRHEVNPS
jgi:uncharacterized protein (TIGR02391 family)